MQRRKRTQSGVTLIEMLVVVTIIALFVAVVAPKMLRRADSARVTAARQQMNAFGTALGAYKLDTGIYPSTEQGLAALKARPENVNNWQGPYMQDVPTDPWQRPYVYKFPGEHGDEPDIVCLGADGQPGGTDINEDVVSWKSK
ncbi:MAG: type II secretion system protein GspG [Acidobacteriia bacterium 12-62-4]|nr:MAG: type II secretion system protein GspG [Acidobacteriia bacterium 12-62-4]